MSHNPVFTIMIVLPNQAKKTVAHIPDPPGHSNLHTDPGAHGG